VAPVVVRPDMASKAFDRIFGVVATGLAHGLPCNGSDDGRPREGQGVPVFAVDQRYHQRRQEHHREHAHHESDDVDD
jgi:hypothetical protein